LRAQLHVSADDHYPVAHESYLGTNQRGTTVAHPRGCYQLVTCPWSGSDTGRG
jgi:hypothetical protein